MTFELVPVVLAAVPMILSIAVWFALTWSPRAVAFYERHPTAGPILLPISILGMVAVGLSGFVWVSMWAPR